MSGWCPLRTEVVCVNLSLQPRGVGAQRPEEEGVGEEDPGGAAR